MRRCWFLAAVALLAEWACVWEPSSRVATQPRTAAAAPRASADRGEHASGSARRCARSGAIRPGSANAPPWTERLEALVGHKAVGIAVATRGGIVYEHRARVPRAPASNQKLLLTMALFDAVGPGFRIPTFAAARRSRGGVVEGDLWVIGRGDPTLTDHQPGFWGPLVRATTLSRLAAQIKAAGVTAVEGRVMAAGDFFAHDFDARGWESYVPRLYVQLPAALSVNGNFSGARSPERRAASAFKRELRKAGVAVRGSVGTGDPPPGLMGLARVRSAPLRDISAYMNKTSNNFFAEMLGKLLGAMTYGPPGTIPKGARAITSWVRKQGVNNVAYDSSGLSYEDRLSPYAVVRLLAVAQKRYWIKALRASLPEPGEGTLLFRLAGLDVRAKTGTLFHGESALSGWVRTARRRTWTTFSILDRGASKRFEDRIVRILASARIRPRPSPSCRLGG